MTDRLSHGDIRSVRHEHRGDRSIDRVDLDPPVPSNARRTVLFTSAGREPDAQGSLS